MRRRHRRLGRPGGGRQPAAAAGRRVASAAGALRLLGAVACSLCLLASLRGGGALKEASLAYTSFQPRAVGPAGPERCWGAANRRLALGAGSAARPPRARAARPAAPFGDLYGTKVPEGHDSTVIWLHGLGDTGRGWTDVAGPRLREQLPRTRFLFPTAPTQPVTVNMGMSMPSWFDINTLDLNLFSMDPPGLAESATYLDGLVERQLDDGIPRERVVLAGFSQGGAVCLAAALGASCGVGAVLMLSTFVASKLPEKLEGLPRFHWFHGEDDTTVPIAWGRKSHELLQSRGVQSSFRSYAGMAHSACVEEINDISDVLVQTLNSEPVAG